RSVRLSVSESVHLRLGGTIRDQDAVSGGAVLLPSHWIGPRSRCPLPSTCPFTSPARRRLHGSQRRHPLHPRRAPDGSQLRGSARRYANGVLAFTIPAASGTSTAVAGSRQTAGRWRPIRACRSTTSPAPWSR